MVSEPYCYQSRLSTLSSALTAWEFESFQHCETSVLPDGCRDIIVQERPDKAVTWFTSELSRSAYSVSCEAGTRMRGLRLGPDVQILESELTSWLQARNPLELFESDQLDEFCLTSENLTTALAGLASGQRTVLFVAKELGVSLRTLERLVKSCTNKPPYFWFSLARARKAGRVLDSAINLSDVALELGFSDQAHMTREMKKWFGRTPAQLRMDKEFMSALAEPGYGTE